MHYKLSKKRKITALLVVIAVVYTAYENFVDLVGIGLFLGAVELLMKNRKSSAKQTVKKGEA